MRKQYLVIAQQKYQQKENRWTNVRLFFNERLSGPRYYETEEEARRALASYIALRNKDYKYDASGKRIDTQVCGMIGIDTVYTKEDDDELRVVAWKIKVRDCTAEVSAEGESMDECKVVL